MERKSSGTGWQFPDFLCKLVMNVTNINKHNIPKLIKHSHNLLRLMMVEKVITTFGSSNFKQMLPVFCPIF